MDTLNYIYGRTRTPMIYAIGFAKAYSHLSREDYINTFNEISVREGVNTLEEAAKKLFKKQTKLDKNNNHSLEDCYSFLEQLFIDQSRKGYEMELEALKWLKNKSKEGWVFKESSQKLDRDYNIDIVGTDGDIKCYIQVKPSSYKNTDKSVKKLNYSKEAKFGRKIHYIYYDRHGNFTY